MYVNMLCRTRSVCRSLRSLNPCLHQKNVPCASTFLGMRTNFESDSVSIRSFNTFHSNKFLKRDNPLSLFNTSASRKLILDIGSLRYKSVAVDPKYKRNVAIIAHVDHGKTSLVDCLLTQSGTMQNVASDELLMDSNPLERERGITILSKSTAIRYQHKRENKMYHINIVDTPGHADFGGEVERVMSMVDGVVLVVDATDGPMTQTKFVLSKALKQGLKPLVVINKVDRPTARVEEVESEIFDLFCMLEPTDEQLDYEVLYASAKEGFATTSMDEESSDMECLFEKLVESVPPPKVDTDSPFSMLVTQIEGNSFLGKCLIGRVLTGRVSVGDTLQALDEEGTLIDSGIRVQKLFGRMGMEQTVLDTAESGDIVSIAGFKNATVNSTLCDESITEAIDVSIHTNIKHIHVCTCLIAVVLTTVHHTPYIIHHTSYIHLHSVFPLTLLRCR